MHIIATTRFNEKTWKENKEWRKKHEWTGCVYGTPKQIGETHLADVPIFVLEMNNSKNKIEGVGLIRNRPVTKEKHKIYEDNNYNRYTYKSIYRISRKEMSKEQKRVLRALDTIVFKGSRHLKRGQGIIALPNRIVNVKCFDFRMFFRNMFKERFGHTTDLTEDMIRTK